MPNFTTETQLLIAAVEAYPGQDARHYNSLLDNPHETMPVISKVLWKLRLAGLLINQPIKRKNRTISYAWFPTQER